MIFDCSSPRCRCWQRQRHDHRYREARCCHAGPTIFPNEWDTPVNAWSLITFGGKCTDFLVIVRSGIQISWTSGIFPTLPRLIMSVYVRLAVAGRPCSARRQLGYLARPRSIQCDYTNSHSSLCSISVLTMLTERMSWHFCPLLKASTLSLSLR
jgi:hypothetical protein